MKPVITALLSVGIAMAAVSCGDSPTTVRAGAGASSATPSPTPSSTTLSPGGPTSSLDPGVSPSVVRGPLPDVSTVQKAIRATPEWTAGVRSGVGCAEAEDMIAKAGIRYDKKPSVTLYSWTSADKKCVIVGWMTDPFGLSSATPDPAIVNGQYVFNDDGVALGTTQEMTAKGSPG
jgi:hypothetical protein